MNMTVSAPGRLEYFNIRLRDYYYINQRNQIDICRGYKLQNTRTSIVFILLKYVCPAKKCWADLYLNSVSRRGDLNSRSADYELRYHKLLKVYAIYLIINMANEAKLHKPVIVITGANNGIGFFMASTLLADGYRVAGLDLSGENLIQLQKDHSSDLLFYKCDVTNEQEIKSTVDDIVNKWSQIDVLVNNACIALFAPFEENKLEDTRREFEVNYYGYVRMIQAVLPYMKARKNGIIHNVSSSVGFTGYKGIYGYTSTKGAIEGLTRTLAMELEPYGITVNTMHPTLTNTKSASPLHLPKEAMAKPEDVGRKLAKKIMSKKPVVTGDLTTAIGVSVSQKFPVFMGKMFNRMTDRAKKQG
jgi:NAD(P)-dependent dehydrogenase (short-subunit alcohol dehydrogenase family)